MEKLYKFLSVPYGRKKLVLRAIFILSGIRIGLWLLPFEVLDRWLSKACPHVENGETDWNLVNRVVGAVKSCSQFVPFATCLTQALATRTLLRIDRQPCDLKIGVEKDERKKLSAHAWIEIKGQIVIGRVANHHRFAVLSSN